MKKKISILESPGFLLMHAACLLAVWSGVSPVALFTCIALYVIRMFGITAGYHRYFSHGSYKTSRFFQFVLAWLGASAAQQGPLWWASHHRHHHKYSDTDNDVHSPLTQGFWWSHIGWVLSPGFHETRLKMVPDLARYPELRFINRFYLLPPISLAVLVWATGALLEHYFSGLGTTGFQMLVWGFFISTVVLYHGTFTVNSLAHIIGRRRFETNDGSRNSAFVALITLGEGWHNNHHYFPSSERQGFYWWEIDVSHYVLRLLSRLGIVWDLKTPPRRVYETAAKGKAAEAGSAETTLAPSN
ncbi:MAG TPA: acyl-CoA desaturase [Pyrinomonadaceae bacterium]|jgi:stearoyl-CoA desaturase (delta-9 desaturase)